MFYHVNSFVVDNLHYECNYQHRFQPPAFCTFPTCSSKRIRPADWIEAVGYKYLRYVTRLHIKESTVGWLSAFDIKLEQNVKEKVLQYLPGSCWKAYDRDKDGSTLYWYGYEAADPLSELLQEIIDRLLQPGLSPRAIQEIVRKLTTDFGIARLMPTMGLEENRHVGRLPTREILGLMTCSDSEVRSWVESIAGGDGEHLKMEIYNTVLRLRSRFQWVKDDP